MIAFQLSTEMEIENVLRSNEYSFDNMAKKSVFKL